MVVAGRCGCDVFLCVGHVVRHKVRDKVRLCVQKHGVNAAFRAFMGNIMYKFICCVYIMCFTGGSGGRAPRSNVIHEKNSGHPYISVEVAVVIMR